MCILQPSSCCLEGHYVCLHLCLVTGWHGHSSRHVSSYHGPHLCNVLLFWHHISASSAQCCRIWMKLCHSYLCYLYLLVCVSIIYSFYICLALYRCLQSKWSYSRQCVTSDGVMAVCSAVWLPSQLIHNWRFASWILHGRRLRQRQHASHGKEEYVQWWLQRMGLLQG